VNTLIPINDTSNRTIANVVDKFVTLTWIVDPALIIQGSGQMNGKLPKAPPPAAKPPQRFWIGCGESIKVRPDPESKKLINKAAMVVKTAKPPV
jgi:hypothetical protein